MTAFVGTCKHGQTSINCIECYRLSYCDAQDELRALKLQISTMVAENEKMMLERNGFSEKADVAERLNGELRNALETVDNILDDHGYPKGSSVRNVIEDALKETQTEKRKCECVWLDGGVVGEYRDPAKKCPVHDKRDHAMSCQCGDVTHCEVCGRRAQGLR